MTEQLTVLFLCTGNSARSILSEAILNKLSCGRFKAYSAGSKPLGRVNPFALELLKQKEHPTAFARSKSWIEFEGALAPQLDFVLTVCDSAAEEQCPLWQGAPMTSHWGIPDPAAISGSNAEKRRAFNVAYTLLNGKIRKFVDLPFEQLSSTDLKKELDQIGRMGLEAAIPT